MKAIRVKKTGGIEALEYVDVDTPKPGRGEVLLRIEAVGVNFIDVYHRTGLYPMPLPFSPGSEAAGVVEEVGEGVEGVKKGDRAAHAMVRGSYAEYQVVPADRLVPLPEAIDARRAAAAMLQGMTAHYLAMSTYPLKQGDVALIHAAAGGVGALLVQIAKLRGAHVIGTASTKHLHVVREAGADEVIDYTKDDFTQLVKNANVVYDSVGKTTFDGSLSVLAPRGMLVLFGQSSGPVPPVDPSKLAKASYYLTRPSLHAYTATREELLERAHDLFKWIASGKVKLRVDRELPLRDAAEAHRALEARETTGKVLLIP